MLKEVLIVKFLSFVFLTVTLASTTYSMAPNLENQENGRSLEEFEKMTENIPVKLPGLRELIKITNFQQEENQKLPEEFSQPQQSALPSLLEDLQGSCLKTVFPTTTKLGETIYSPENEAWLLALGACLCELWFAVDLAEKSNNTEVIATLQEIAKKIPKEMEKPRV